MRRHSGQPASSPTAATAAPAKSGKASSGVTRIKDIVDFEGVRDNMLVGYGLAHMVGLLDYRTGCLRGSTKPRCLETAHGYSVPGALIAGGKFVLAGGFLVWGAHFTRTRVRQRQRNDAHQQPDL